MKKRFTVFLFFIVSLSSQTFDKSSIQLPRRDLPDENLFIKEMNSRVINLEHKAVYQNNSTDNIKTMFHHVTIPSLSEDYQILLSIETKNIDDSEIREHKNKIDSYLHLKFNLPARETKVITVIYTILIIPIDYSSIFPSADTTDITESNKIYLKPSSTIESDSKVFIELAKNFRLKSENNFELIKLLYEFPSKHLKFKVQNKNIGALAAFNKKQGDCTEFASLFIALCRASGFPARYYSVFSMSDKIETEWKAPNHTIAEVYLNPLGWFPVDTNLSFGGYTNKHRLGVTPDNIIYMQREGAWTWGNYIPEKNFDKKKIGVKVSWRAKVIETGSAKTLFQKFYNR